MGIAFDIASTDSINSLMHQSIVDESYIERKIFEEGDYSVIDKLNEAGIGIRILPMILKRSIKGENGNPEAWKNDVKAAIAKCKDQKDIDAMRQGNKSAAEQLAINRVYLKKYIRGDKDHGLDRQWRKAVDDGRLTVAKFDSYIKWLKGDAVKLLNAREKEIKKNNKK